MIPNEIIEDIKNKADIVQVISSFIKVIKKGNSYTAICPFHNDTNPSLHISQTKQIFTCFVCHTSGNVFSFVEKYEKCSFVEAVKKVADIIGYTSPYLLETERKIDDRTKNALKACKDAKDFYHYVLETQAGSKGKEYLNSRQIDDDMINYFSLGFAPSNGELTIKQLRGKNNSIESLEDAGILLRHGDAFSDRFQNRVIFPIYNEYLDVIGYSGRIIDKSDEAKYVNSPATILFNKSNILFNIQNAKNEAKRDKYCYIVEGFMDVFALYKAGIKSSIALMGTAFTKYHAKVLKKLNVELRLCLDGDNAGQHGMLNMIKILDEEGLNYRFVNYEGDLRDPDEILIQDGKDALINRLNKLIKKNEFIINYFKTGKDLNSIDEKKDFLNNVGEYYLSIIDEVEKDLFIDEIAKLTSLTSLRVQNYFNSNYKVTKKEEPIVNVEYNIPKSKFSKMRRIERNLIYYMIKSQETYNYIQAKETVPFIEDIYLELSNYIGDLYMNNEIISVSSLILRIQETQDNKKLIDELTSISLDDSIPEPFTNENIDELFDQLNRLLNKQQFNRMFYKDDLSVDELSKAKMLDQIISKK